MCSVNHAGYKALNRQDELDPTDNTDQELNDLDHEEEIDLYQV